MVGLYAGVVVAVSGCEFPTSILNGFDRAVDGISGISDLFGRAVEDANSAVNLGCGGRDGGVVMGRSHAFASVLAAEFCKRGSRDIKSGLSAYGFFSLLWQPTISVAAASQAADRLLFRMILNPWQFGD
jgi:hypothetical protein